MIESVEEAKRGGGGSEGRGHGRFFNSFFYENSTMKMCHSLDKL